MKLHLRTAADDGVWLCCVGCFQNSSPQTSLVISLRKLQPDLPAFFTSSVFLGKGSGFGGPFLDLVHGGPSLGTSAFLDDGQIVALCNSPLPFNLVLFELGAPRGDMTETPACGSARPGKPGLVLDTLSQATWPTELGCRAEWLASPSPDFS